MGLLTRQADHGQSPPAFRTEKVAHQPVVTADHGVIQNDLAHGNEQRYATVRAHAFDVSVHTFLSFDPSAGSTFLHDSRKGHVDVKQALSDSLTQGVFEFFYRFHEVRQKVR